MVGNTLEKGINHDGDAVRWQRRVWLKCRKTRTTRWKQVAHLFQFFLHTAYYHSEPSYFANRTIENIPNMISNPTKANEMELKIKSKRRLKIDQQKIENVTIMRTLTHRFENWCRIHLRARWSRTRSALKAIIFTPGHTSIIVSPHNEHEDHWPILSLVPLRPCQHIQREIQ